MAAKPFTSSEFWTVGRVVRSTRRIARRPTSPTSSSRAGVDDDEAVRIRTLLDASRAFAFERERLEDGGIVLVSAIDPSFPASLASATRVELSAVPARGRPDRVAVWRRALGMAGSRSASPTRRSPSLGMRAGPPSTAIGRHHRTRHGDRPGGDRHGRGVEAAGASACRPRGSTSCRDARRSDGSSTTASCVSPARTRRTAGRRPPRAMGRRRSSTRCRPSRSSSSADNEFGRQGRAPSRRCSAAGAPRGVDRCWCRRRQRRTGRARRPPDPIASTSCSSRWRPPTTRPNPQPSLF